METTQTPHELAIHMHTTRLSQLLGRQPWELEQSKREGSDTLELQKLHAGEFGYVKRQFEALGENDWAMIASGYADRILSSQDYLPVTEPPIENRNAKRSWE